VMSSTSWNMALSMRAVDSSRESALTPIANIDPQPYPPPQPPTVPRFCLEFPLNVAANSRVEPTFPLIEAYFPSAA